MTALARQADSLSHYTAMQVQPMEFTMANGWDSCAHTILKYISRHARKHGRLDLEKARHIIEMRAELTANPRGVRRAMAVFNSLIVAFIGYVPIEKEDTRIPMEVYISANRIDKPEADVLLLLEQWVKHDPNNHSMPARYAQVMLKALDDLIYHRYGEKHA